MFKNKSGFNKMKLSIKFKNTEIEEFNYSNFILQNFKKNELIFFTFSLKLLVDRPSFLKYKFIVLKLS